MSCCRGQCGGDVRKVDLVFKRSNLDYSISNYAYIESHVMDEGGECSRHMVADICESGNRDRVTRLLDVIHLGVAELLFPLTKYEAEEVIGSDCLSEPDGYVIELNLPSGMSGTTVRLLGKLIHEYMVCRVLEDWLSITNRGDSAAALTWRAKADEAKEEIERIKNHRTGRTRIRLHPW